jgi:predicted RNA binding protein YcfA (HicA-like mRNA interferase family)
MGNRSGGGQRCRRYSRLRCFRPGRANLIQKCAADHGHFPRSVYHTHVKSADIIKELKAAGWVLDRIRGSHHVFKHPTRPGFVVVPHPQKDLGTGLLAAIRKQAGL